MLKSKRLFIFMTVIILLVMAYLYILIIRNVNTDKVGIIEEYLSEIFKEDQNIEIINTDVVLNNEIMGFKYGEYNQFGFAVIKKEDSKYYLSKCYLRERMAKRATGVYVQYLDLSDEQKSVSYMVILNLNDKLTEMEFSVDGNKLNFVDINPAPSITVIETPTSNYKYLFYDAFNNIIE